MRITSKNISISARKHIHLQRHSTYKHINPTAAVAQNESGRNNTEADGKNLNNDNGGNNSANRSDNLQISDIKPAQSLLDNIVSGSVAERTPAPTHCSLFEIIVRENQVSTPEKRRFTK